MAIKTINQLIKTNAFINLDGSIECIDAFVDMMAYYYGVKDYTAKTADEKKICDDAIVELSMMAGATGRSEKRGSRAREENHGSRRGKASAESGISSGSRRRRFRMERSLLLFAELSIKCSE